MLQHNTYTQNFTRTSRPMLSSRSTEKERLLLDSLAEFRSNVTGRIKVLSDDNDVIASATTTGRRTGAFFHSSQQRLVQLEKELLLRTEDILPASSDRLTVAEVAKICTSWHAATSLHTNRLWQDITNEKSLECESAHDNDRWDGVETKGTDPQRMTVGNSLMDEHVDEHVDEHEPPEQEQEAPIDECSRLDSAERVETKDESIGCTDVEFDFDASSLDAIEKWRTDRRSLLPTPNGSIDEPNGLTIFTPAPLAARAILPGATTPSVATGNIGSSEHDQTDGDDKNNTTLESFDASSIASKSVRGPGYWRKVALSKAINTTLLSNLEPVDEWQQSNASPDDDTDRGEEKQEGRVGKGTNTVPAVVIETFDVFSPKSVMRNDSFFDGSFLGHPSMTPAKMKTEALPSLLSVTKHSGDIDYQSDGNDQNGSDDGKSNNGNVNGNDKENEEGEKEDVDEDSYTTATPAPTITTHYNAKDETLLVTPVLDRYRLDVDLVTADIRVIPNPRRSTLGRQSSAKDTMSEGRSRNVVNDPVQARPRHQSEIISNRRRPISQAVFSEPRATGMTIGRPTTVPSNDAGRILDPISTTKTGHVRSRATTESSTDHVLQQLRSPLVETGRHPGPSSFLHRNKTETRTTLMRSSDAGPGCRTPLMSEWKQRHSTMSARRGGNATTTTHTTIKAGDVSSSPFRDPRFAKVLEYDLNAVDGPSSLPTGPWQTTVHPGSR